MEGKWGHTLRLCTASLRLAGFGRGFSKKRRRVSEMCGEPPKRKRSGTGEMVRVSERDRVLGTAVVVGAAGAAAYYVLWVFGGAWMTPAVAHALHMPPKETGVWLAACLVASLFVLVAAVLGCWFCAAAAHAPRPQRSSSSSVPTPAAS